MTSRGGIKNVVIEGFVLVRFFFLLLFLSSLQILPASVFPFIILSLSELENLREFLVFCISPFLFVRVAPFL